ncbi:MAG: hypothetical protein AAFX44_08195 [Pseudomonadota bacterium]
MIRTGLCALGAMMATASVQAEVSYNYFELGFQETEIDVGPFDVDGDGFFGGLSFSVTESFFLIGDYSTADLEGVDLNRFRAGFGYHTDVSEPAQFVVQATFQNLELDAGSFDEDDSGYGISIGGRGEFTEQIEWDLFLDYVDIDDAETGFSGELRYKFTPQAAFGLNFETIDDIDIIGVHFRWMYAN